jgi:succinoglycan biosynthesis protein ExoM
VSSGSRTSVAVYICTFERNELLTRLLEALERVAEHAASVADVGAVVADDNPDGRAKVVAAAWQDRFPLGVQYVHVGLRNISAARNAGIEIAMRSAAWTAMTDDDCIPDPGWITALLDVQRRTGAGAVVGRTVKELTAETPRWLRDQPFARLGQLDSTDGAEVAVGATNNSMIESRFLVDHPAVRFDRDMGVIGGEDMVFFHRAREAGLEIRYARDAVVAEVEQPARRTLRYQIRIHYWLGNSESVTNLRLGYATRSRLIARSGRRMLSAALRPLRRLLTGRPPHLRYAAARLAMGAGGLAGAAGIRVRHH